MASPQQELVILRKYATGAELAAISKELGIDHEVTVEVVSAVGFQRARAQELLRQREAALVGSQRSARPVSSPPAAATDVKVDPVAPFQAPVEALLAAADRIGHPRLAKQAQKVREAVEVLRELVTGHEKRAEAEHRVAELRRQLANAEAQLRQASGAPVRAGQPAASGGPTSREVRAWAAANGVECGAVGRVPATVMQAYFAANGGSGG